MDFPQQNSRGWGAARSMLAATLVAILVAACGGGSGGGPGMPTISAGGGPSGGTVKVALLLPLTSSGNTPAVAKALKQAAELALFDYDNPGVALVPKDTHGTPDGSRVLTTGFRHAMASSCTYPNASARVTDGSTKMSQA